MKIVDGAQVEDAVLATLKAWLPWHLAQVEDGRDMERGKTARPVAWEIVGTLNETPIRGTPMVVIESPGFQGRPTSGVSFDSHATWRIMVHVFTASTTRRGAAVNARIYSAAIRSCLLLHPDLGGLASGVLQADEDYSGEFRDEENRQFLAVSHVAATVQVHEVLSADDIPKVPPPDPLTPPAEAIEARTIVVTASDTGQSVTVEAPEDPEP